MLMMTRGRYRQDYLTAFLFAPVGPETAMRQLVEAQGSRLLGFYFTADTDLLMITETTHPDHMAATAAAVAGTGLMTDVTAFRAWTCAEFRAREERASVLPSSRGLTA